MFRGKYEKKFTEHEKKILLSLMAIEKITSLKLHKVLKVTGSIEEISTLSAAEFAIYFEDKSGELYSKFLYNLDFDFDSYFKFYNVKCIFCDDIYYPKEFFRLYDYPFVIFYRGNKKLLLFGRKLSIVGSRNNTCYSEEALDVIVPYLTKNNFVIVSGLAYGVDSLAHSSVIESNGFTIGVIAHGHNIIYPEQSKSLYEELEKNHLIISEYFPTSPIRKYKFLERNRLVAGLSWALLVTEAAKRSGTSRTVNFALDVGNTVFCLPGKFGDKMSIAINEYIKEGAVLVNKLEDFNDELGF
ncbi:DNA processing protein DprA [Gemella sp. oral taxon 928]|uniref:DNA-processing protein DprA n=2 Tax=Gemella TaxID=1378 RepID=UPI000767E514|nr:MULTISPECIES: DNA-processing protein DprA [unclassified Gemella]AME10121.1 DNA processing protein DprA [Gemella sp. oral taxon 928]AXI26257.1 DNA-protecting protein DprA [Gemella sp. ND 6198]